MTPFRHAPILYYYEKVIIILRHALAECRAQARCRQPALLLSLLLFLYRWPASACHSHGRRSSNTTSGLPPARAAQPALLLPRHYDRRTAASSRPYLRKPDVSHGAITWDGQPSRCSKLTAHERPPAPSHASSAGHAAGRLLWFSALLRACLAWAYRPITSFSFASFYRPAIITVRPAMPEMPRFRHDDFLA